MYHVSPPESESDIERDEEDGYGCSDDEYVELRKKNREEKKKMDEAERLADLGDDGVDSSESDGAYYPSSEESDDEFCFPDPPPKNDKLQFVDEVFNVKQRD